MDKEFYKKFQELTHEETYKEVTKDMKDVEEIGDIGLHAEVDFYDVSDIAVVNYYRDSKLLEVEWFTYDEFVELFK